MNEPKMWSKEFFKQFKAKQAEETLTRAEVESMIADAISELPNQTD